MRIIDDITVDERRRRSRLGRLAAYVRDQRIPLEMCPPSNVQTGAAASIAEHPIGLLTRLRFRVTVNTDNRLMSGTSMTEEMCALVEAFGYGLADLRVVHRQRDEVGVPALRRAARAHRPSVIKPGYAALRLSSPSTGRTTTNQGCVQRPKGSGAAVKASSAVRSTTRPRAGS